MTYSLAWIIVWADNADAISIAYSGTGALKTDFTRTGKRTYAGALQDLRNSVVRYWSNNYRDGRRQDAYDLFLGEYVVMRDHRFDLSRSVSSRPRSSAFLKVAPIFYLNR